MFSPPAHRGETPREVPMIILGRFIHPTAAPFLFYLGAKTVAFPSITASPF